MTLITACSYLFFHNAIWSITISIINVPDWATRPAHPLKILTPTPGKPLPLKEGENFWRVTKLPPSPLPFIYPPMEGEGFVHPCYTLVMMNTLWPLNSNDHWTQDWEGVWLNYGQCQLPLSNGTTRWSKWIVNGELPGLKKPFMAK